MVNENDLWMTHYSVHSWRNPNEWDEYLRLVESKIGDRLVKLDVHDPARRKADAKKNGEGKFIVQFGNGEDRRWLWGQFENTKIEVNIEHSNSAVDSFGRQTKNLITFYVPQAICIRKGMIHLIDLFRLSNELLGAFYGYADFKRVICSKRPSTPSLDISRELLGVFWLTYFGPPYCAFFGRDRLLGFKQAVEGPADGITLQLAENPNQIGDGERSLFESNIRAESFAGSGGSKERGQHALTLVQLRSCEVT